jgi:hypothetical protein
MLHEEDRQILRKALQGCQLNGRMSKPKTLTFSGSQGSLARIRPDMRIVVADDFEKLADLPSPARGRRWRHRASKDARLSTGYGAA